MVKTKRGGTAEAEAWAVEHEAAYGGTKVQNSGVPQQVITPTATIQASKRVDQPTDEQDDVNIDAIPTSLGHQLTIADTATGATSLPRDIKQARPQSYSVLVLVLLQISSSIHRPSVQGAYEAQPRYISCAGQSSDPGIDKYLQWRCEPKSRHVVVLTKLWTPKLCFRTVIKGAMCIRFNFDYQTLRFADTLPSNPEVFTFTDKQSSWIAIIPRRASNVPSCRKLYSNRSRSQATNGPTVERTEHYQPDSKYHHKRKYPIMYCDTADILGKCRHVNTCRGRCQSCPRESPCAAQGKKCKRCILLSHADDEDPGKENDTQSKPDSPSSEGSLRQKFETTGHAEDENGDTKLLCGEFERSKG
ncbi:hypothetical protein FMEXI_1644 [Fusarium mexicanum]|uniref:Uncharacterized protein n=1 Tax=Fusarium mexicanum TaxID=751941 RepID=A0A8H5JGV8_9HYPO|nr:hypothetical protein FMEXI_1644 [Fusarium mexicanum]